MQDSVRNFEIDNRLNPVKVKVGERYKTTRGYVAQITEERLGTGEFCYIANIYNHVLRYDGRARYNCRGEVDGLNSYYGHLIK